MGTLAGPSVGSRLAIEYVREDTWGEYVPGGMAAGNALGTNGQAMTVTSESIKHTINNLVSATLTSQRGLINQIRGSSDVGGDLNFELAGDDGEYSQMMKMAMTAGAAGSDNYVSVQGAIGHWGLQVAEPAIAGAADLVLKGDPSIFANWDAAPGGTCVVVNRDVNGALTTDAETYTAVASSGVFHTLTIAALANGHVQNAWAFPTDAGTKYNNTYLHYFECGAYIGTGMNLDILRDVALFVYTGMKVSSWTMNFNPGEIVNGVFSLLGSEENCGGVTLSEVATSIGAGASTVSLSDIRAFKGCSTAAELAAGFGQTGDLIIGIEGSVDIASIAAAGLTYPAAQITTGATPGGDISLGTDQIAGATPGYFTGTAAGSQNSRAHDGAGNDVNLQQTTLLDIPPFAGFEAVIYQQGGLSGGPDAGGVPTAASDMGVQATEVVSATFTLDNGLFTDKFVLGNRFRVMLPEQRRNITGTLTFEFDNLIQYRKFYDGTPFSFVLMTVSQDTAEGYIDNTGGSAVDVPRSICFYFHDCKYDGDTPNADSEDIILVDQPFRAFVHSGQVSSTVGSSGDNMPFNELTMWITTARSTSLWA